MKGVIKAIAEKTWKDKVFWEFQLEDDERVFSCWQDSFAGKKIGSDIEFEAVEKDGRWRAKIAGSGGGFQPRGKSPEEMKQQVRSFSASYSKDIVVACINRDIIKTSKEIDATLLHYYEFFIKVLEA